MADTLLQIPAKNHPEEGLSELDSIKNLKLTDLQSIFYVCILGLIISSFIFICEIVISLILNKIFENLKEKFITITAYDMYLQNC